MMNPVKGQRSTTKKQPKDDPPAEGSLCRGASDSKCKAADSAGDKIKMAAESGESKEQIKETTKQTAESLEPANRRNTFENFNLQRHFRGASVQALSANLYRTNPVCAEHFVHNLISFQNAVLQLVKVNDLDLPLIKVDPTLTFRKYFNFNHPVYGTQICIHNVSSKHVAFKILPSATQKLCLTESQGIVGPGATALVSMATHSMIPFTYLDILEESVEVAYAPVTLLDSRTRRSLGSMCNCLWDKVDSGHLNAFWSVHQPGTDVNVDVIRIDTFLPFDAAYLDEKSVFWTQWKPYRILKDLVSPATLSYCCRGVTHLFHCDCEEGLRLFWILVSCIFPRCLSLERTQWLATRPKKPTAVAKKQKFLKLIIMGFLLFFLLYCPPILPHVKTFMDSLLKN